MAPQHFFCFCAIVLTLVPAAKGGVKRTHVRMFADADDALVYPTRMNTYYTPLLSTTQSSSLANQNTAQETAKSSSRNAYAANATTLRTIELLDRAIRIIQLLQGDAQLLEQTLAIIRQVGRSSGPRSAILNERDLFASILGAALDDTEYAQHLATILVSLPTKSAPPSSSTSLQKSADSDAVQQPQYQKLYSSDSGPQEPVFRPFRYGRRRR